MAVPFIAGPREGHPGVSDASSYRAAHAAFVARKIAKGARFTVHEDPIDVVARVEANRWLVDCPCGNGCLTDPQFGFACCYACGAVLTRVAFPEPVTLAQLEAVLIARPVTKTRNWTTAEPVTALVAENDANGVVTPDLKAIAVTAARAALEKARKLPLNGIVTP